MRHMANKKTDSKNSNSNTSSAASSSSLSVVPSSYDMRTQAGREQYDAAVAKALKANRGGEGIDAATLVAKVGGTKTQLRASLARLIDSGTATKSGVTRTTRYRAAG